MFDSTFRRPIGANADAKELEYVTALHQTTDDDEAAFVDGSIEAKDVKYYLMSRYGIQVESAQIKKFIFQDLAGGGSDSDCIDTCELVAMLLIPFLVKHVKAGASANDNASANASDNDILRAFSSNSQMKSFMDDMDKYNINTNIATGTGSTMNIFQIVLNIILADSGYITTTDTITDSDLDSDSPLASSSPPVITKDLLKTIFARYGEAALLNDEQLLDDMIHDISSSSSSSTNTGSEAGAGAVLDAHAFARALTEDVLLYNVDYESRVSTHFEDVFGRNNEARGEMQGQGQTQGQTQGERDPLQDADADADPELNIAQQQQQSPVFRNVFTLSQVDFLADTCQSKIHLTIIYLVFVLLMYIFSNNDPITVCPTTTFGCQIANSVTFWLIVIGIMVGVGMPFILSLSSGNTQRGNSILSIGFGMFGIGWFVLTPAFVKFKMGILSNVPLDNGDSSGSSSSTTWNISEKSARVLFIQIVITLFAVVLFCIQVMNLIRIVRPKIVSSSNRVLAYLFTRGTVRETFLLKVASTLKIQKMVKNALDLHFEGGNFTAENKKTNTNVNINTVRASTNALALLNYDKSRDKTETIGGVCWLWKGYITKSLIHTEGVVVNSRLVLCNALQFFTIIIILVQITSIASTTEDTLYPTFKHEHKECEGFEFDPDKCISLEMGSIPTGMALCYDISADKDHKCLSEEYFQPLMPESNGEYTKYPLLDMLCDKIDDLLEETNEIVWSIIHQAMDTPLFTDVATQVVGTSLCLGLNSLNYTVWDALANQTTSATFESCNAPQQPFCNATFGQHAAGSLDYESAMNSLIVSYEDTYKKAIQPAVECLEKSNSDAAINYMLGQATGSLQNTLGETMQASWSVPFQFFPNANEAISTGNVNDQMKKWINTTLSSDLADKLVTNVPILNDTELVGKISNPVLPVTPDIVQIQDATTNLIDVAFTQLNITLIDLKKAADTNLASLPSYFNLPDLPSSSLCENTWLVRPDVNILAETKGSTASNYCRTHLTACTRTGICVVGLDIFENTAGSKLYTSFRFAGGKCDDYPVTKSLLESKKSLGALEVYIPSTIVVAFTLALAAMLSISALFIVAMLFIPSVILTTLKYRSGILPSLRSERFKMYRENMVNLTYLVPVTFWSALVMTFILFFIFALIIFFLIWEQSRKIVVGVIATLIGVSITIVLKKAIFTAIGKFGFAAFYRKRPAMVNVASVALECWNIFLSIAFVTSRVAVLFVTVILFIGRIDRPILAEDLTLDGYPHVFRQAVLASDAHRHPYIERLGMMYLMKLKHGDKFGKRSSSTWRLLFVFALMPWLRKYRILGETENEGMSSENMQVEKLMEDVARLKAMNRDLMERIEVEKRRGDIDDDDLSYASASAGNQENFKLIKDKNI